MAPFTRSNLAQVSLYLGEWESARRYAEESLAAFQACGNASRAAYPLSFLGELALRTGDAERAEQALGESARIARQVGDMQALRYAERLLAERDIVAGAPERAMLALEPLLDRPGLQELDVAYILPTLAWAYLAQGDVAAARRHVGQALSRASAQGNRLVWHDALRIHGLTLAREGAWDDAAAALNEGLRMASAMPYPFAEARFWQAIASVERRQGERAQAQAALRRAADILRRLGARDE
jgi:tetratricopeptide (TPR) repeat protein